jgi:hypothetical protein
MDRHNSEEQEYRDLLEKSCWLMKKVCDYVTN